MNKVVAAIFLTFSILAGISYFIGYRKFCSFAESNDEKLYLETKKYMKIALIFLVISFSIFVIGGVFYNIARILSLS